MKLSSKDLTKIQMIMESMIDPDPPLNMIFQLGLYYI
jgi:hypothetical protein